MYLLHYIFHNLHYYAILYVLGAHNFNTFTSLKKSRFFLDTFFCVDFLFVCLFVCLFISREKVSRGCNIKIPYFKDIDQSKAKYSVLYVISDTIEHFRSLPFKSLQQTNCCA